MLADESKAVSACLTGWALSTATNVPLLETCSAPKGPLIGTVAFLGGLGELTRQGKLSSDVAGYILAALLIPVSLQEIAAPQATLDAFGLPKPSTLTKSLFENFSFTKMSTGLFLLVGKLTGKRGLGLAASAGGQLLNTVKTITRADDVGLNKPALCVWSGIQAMVALLAYKNEMAEA